MKIKLLIISFILLSFLKDNKDITGTYIYSSQDIFYTEKIIFSKNYTFNYQFRSELIIESINGYYSFFNDTIILNSLPQRDKLIVNEKYIKKNYYLFEITDKQMSSLIYNLYLLYEDNSLEKIRDQYISSKIKKKEVPIKGFYIVTTRGLKSPIYNIKSSVSNHFKILLEPKRTFEAEKWLFNNNEIIPIGIDGKYQEYSLKRDN